VLAGLFSSSLLWTWKPGRVDSLSSNTTRTFYRDYFLWFKSTIGTKSTMMIDLNYPTMQALGRTLNRGKGWTRVMRSAGRDWSIEI
jgi:hypothetical protein